MGLVSEFKEFISKGNVLDLAVGVIIGAAFGKIVTSLTQDIIMPVISIGTDKMGSYKDIMVGPMKVGVFLAAVLDFLIIAFCIFIIVKAANKLKKKPVEVVAVPAGPTTDQALLMEIRDALRSGRL